MLEEEMPGVYVYSLKITGDSNGDIDSSFFIHPTQQVRKTFKPDCHELTLTLKNIRTVFLAVVRVAN